MIFHIYIHSTPVIMYVAMFSERLYSALRYGCHTSEMRDAAFV